MIVKDFVKGQLSFWSNQREVKIEEEMWNILYDLLYSFNIPHSANVILLTEEAHKFLDARWAEIHNYYPKKTDNSKEENVMFKKLLLNKRFVGCIQAPDRCESFEEYFWKKIKVGLEEGHIDYFNVVFYKDWHETFNSVQEVYNSYFNTTNKEVSEEVYNYSLEHIRQNMQKNKTYILLEKEDENGKYFHFAKKK